MLPDVSMYTLIVGWTEKAMLSLLFWVSEDEAWLVGEVWTWEFAFVLGEPEIQDVRMHANKKMDSLFKLVFMVDACYPTPRWIVKQAKAWRWSLFNWQVLGITAWINKHQLHAVNPIWIRRRSELILFTFEFPRFVSENKLHFRVFFYVFSKGKNIFSKSFQ